MNNTYNYTEDFFVKEFVSCKKARSLFADSSFIEELVTPQGKPDVVVINNSGLRKINNFFLTHPEVLLSNTNAKIISLLEGGGAFSMLDIIDVLALSKQTLFKSINNLQKSGLICVSLKGLVRLKATTRFPKVKLTSLEFKLADWNGALMQGIKYSSFSELSYVVMPSNKEKTLRKVMHVFSRFNIGVILFDPFRKIVKRITEPLSSRVLFKHQYLDVLSRINTFQFNSFNKLAPSSSI